MKASLFCLSLFWALLPLEAQDLVFKNNGMSSSLLELYSSEGCSSCPPAEEWTSTLKSSPGLWKDVFPVVFHVDYWDGLGWPDRFARPEFTQRQRHYANLLNQDSVYTPEFVLNGLEWHRGWLSGQIPALGPAKSGELALTFSDKEMKVAATYTPAASASNQPLLLNIALLGFNVITDVRAGENGGRKLQHDFVVLGFSSSPMVSEANGTFQAAPIAIKTSTDDAPGAVVAWVSKDDGSILQVTGGWLSPEAHAAN
jgi:hypothetical protein